MENIPPEPSYFSEKPKPRALASPAFLYNFLGNSPASSQASPCGAISFFAKANDLIPKGFVLGRINRAA